MLYVFVYLPIDITDSKNIKILIPMKIKYIFLFLYLNNFAQIPIKHYEIEIKSLKNETEIEHYWNKIKHIDQKILLKSENKKIYDSISLDNMIKTSLMFEIHGINSCKSNNIIPILNLSHSYVSFAQITFFPIIIEHSKKKGITETFGGKFPAYELESISLCFYDYSLYAQDTIYNKLLKSIELKIDNSIKISEKLNQIYQNQLELNKLKLVKTIGIWYRQQIKNINEDDHLEIIEMNDKSLYIKFNDRLQKLKLFESNSNTKKYRIENEPFNWYYLLHKNKKLVLYNQNNEILISYNLSR